MPIYKLEKATAKGKRYKITSPEGKVIQFGSATGKNFTEHQDEAKKKAWIARHSKAGENWNYSGRDTAGFWAKHLLWSGKTLADSKKYIKERFGIEVK